MSLACPYCGVIPEKEYKYGWKCTGCLNRVHYNKKHPFLYGRDRLTAEEDATIELYDIVSILLEIGEKHYFEMEQSLKDRWKTKAVRQTDVVWGLANSSSLYKEKLDRQYGHLAKSLGGEEGREYYAFNASLLNDSLTRAKERFMEKK